MTIHLIVLIASIIVCLLAFIGDVHSSHINNRIPQIYESRRMFRKGPDRKCDVKKLIVWKIALFTICVAATWIVWQMKDGAKLAFLVFAMMSIITLPTVYKNYRLHRKYT